MKSRTPQRTPLAKCPTGIHGLDDITGGGLPRGRPTLVCGAAGSGKTLLAMEFIVRGARDFGEPGVFMAFEEMEPELNENVASLGFDLASLVRRKGVAIDHVHIERSEIEEAGEYDLEGLFVRLDCAIRSVNARRVVLDGLEALFASLPNEAILRAELRRLFRWLKSRKVTTLITGEQGLQSISRHGLEEYVSDCVIVLDHRVVNQVGTRRLRIVKYRGSAHGTSEYPTMIDAGGLSVLPISSLGLEYFVSRQRVSSGIPDLDVMLGKRGFFRGSSVLVSGTSGTGKSSLAAAFADATSRRKERCLYVAFEESPAQIVRNMTSIGLDLQDGVRKGLLRFHAVRSTFQGLEQHLVMLHKVVQEFRPATVIVDPVSTLTPIGDALDIGAMLTRMIDFLKQQKVTALFTSLTESGAPDRRMEPVISSLMDTWVLLSHSERDGERKLMLSILKSRGMAHSRLVRELVLSHRGIALHEQPGKEHDHDDETKPKARPATLGTQAIRRRPDGAIGPSL